MYVLKCYGSDSSPLVPLCGMGLLEKKSVSQCRETEAMGHVGRLLQNRAIHQRAGAQPVYSPEEAVSANKATER